MSLAMSSQEIEDFLSESKIARIATVKPDDSSHVTPVWYLWEDNQLLMTTMKDSVKIRNIKRNNKVAVTIDNGGAPNKGIIIEGTARIEEELGEEIRKRICGRYVHPDDLDKYLKHELTNLRALIRIHPRKIISWDYSKEPFLSRIRWLES